MSETPGLTAERLAELREVEYDRYDNRLGEGELTTLLDAAEENGRLNNRLIEIHREPGESVNNQPSTIDAFRMLKAERDAALAQLAEWREVAENASDGDIDYVGINALGKKYPKEASK